MPILKEIHFKKPSKLHAYAMTQTRGRRTMNQTRNERLREQVETQLKNVKMHFLSTQKQLELHKRQIDKIERLEIRELELKIKQLRSKSGSPLKGALFNFLFCS